MLEIMESLCVTIIASSATENELSKIKSVVSQAINCSSDVWSLVGPAKASLILIWINSEKDLKAFQIFQNKYPAERIIVFASNEFPIQSRWHLSYAKQNLVPSVLSITNLFSRIQANFLPVDYSDAMAFFDPSQYLLGIIQQASRDNVARICSFQSSPDIYLLPNENSFYISGNIEQLVPMVLASQLEINVKEVDDEQIIEAVSYVKFSSRLSQYLVLDEDSVFEDINVKKYKRYALNELIWFAVLIGSRGRLLNNTSLTKTVLLRQVPEYLRLEYYGKEYKPVADCMTTNAITLHEVCVKTQRSLPEVVSFYNACATLNLIEHGETALKVVEKQSLARKTLENSFNRVGKTSKGRVKIVIAGSVGSGKTAAISALSDFTPISTETRPSDTVTRKKSTTTVAMDYGEIRFHDELKIFLYGTPGQKRFDFMSQLLCENAWGMLLLIDNTENDPIGELDYYLKLFEKFLHKIKLTIGITHCDIAEKPGIDQYVDYLAERNLSYPLMRTDARDFSSLVKLLNTLVEHEQVSVAA